MNGEAISNGSPNLKLYLWDEVKKHTSADDKWLVIDGYVYDITRWSKKHPGGARIISHFAGQDATDAWVAFHKDKRHAAKFMKPLLIGRVEDYKQSEIQRDFRALREQAEDEKLFDVKAWFFLAHLAHIILLEVLAYSFLAYCGVDWRTFLFTSLILATSQAQAGWSQHDYGHHSVMKSVRLNHLLHEFVIGHLKGASSHWWNFRHFQHHAKPNVIAKDPDIGLPKVFLLGWRLPQEWGQKGRKGFLPFNQQQHYFFLLGPMALLPVYFHLENIYFIIRRKEWWDFLWMLSFFVRLFYLYNPYLGWSGTFSLYMLVRFFESWWFTFVTQMNHIPMDVDREKADDWMTQQLKSTCNVESSFFNDWFTGHLNFQIEHHLFPTMPRHNYYKIAPRVKALCEKHSLKYVDKPLWTAFVDIIRSLKSSGELWYHAYHHLG